MALISLADVNDRAAALLDDPGHRRFSTNYLRAHIDQQNEGFMLVLSTMGVQQEEATAVLNLQPNTSDLSAFFGSGQPLQYFMRPVDISWKLQGQPDEAYQPCYPVKELADVDPSNLGCQQYTWIGGKLQVTPSGTAVTLRVRYLAMTMALTDPSGAVTAGAGFIIASLAAQFVCSLNNGMGTLQQRLDKQVSRDKKNLKSLYVQQRQGQNVFPRGVRRTTAPVISAGGSSYS